MKELIKNCTLIFDGIPDSEINSECRTYTKFFTVHVLFWKTFWYPLVSGFPQNMVTQEFKSSPDCHQNFLQRQMVKFLKPVSNTSYLVRKNLTLMETFTFQCIPYLVAISTDNERLCHVKAEQCLNDIDGRYQGFIHMKALQGVKMAYEVQKVIQKVRMKFDTVSMKIRVVNVFQGSSRNFTNI